MQWDPVHLLLLLVPKEAPMQIPRLPSHHLQRHNRQRSQAHHFYTPERAFGPKMPIARAQQLISISTSAFASANNICTFIKSANDVVVEHVHALVTRLVVNYKAPLSLAIAVNLNKVIQVASYLKLGLYVPMTSSKIDRALISMFSKFTVCVNVLIVKACTMYMLAGYEELINKYAGSNCGWLVVCHDG
jgi:hypothetical protein